MGRDTVLSWKTKTPSCGFSLPRRKTGLCVYSFVPKIFIELNRLLNVSCS